MFCGVEVRWEQGRVSAPPTLAASPRDSSPREGPRLGLIPCASSIMQKLARAAAAESKAHGLDILKKVEKLAKFAKKKKAAGRRALVQI